MRWVVYLVFLLALLGINWWMADNALSPTKPTQVAYSFFYQQVQAGNVASINWTGNGINGTLKNPAPYPPGSTDKTVKDFATERPLQAEDNLTTLMLSKNVMIDTHPPPTTPFWQELLLGFGPTLLLLVLIVLGARAMSRGMGGVGGIGRSKAKLYSPEAGPRTTFQDVAGIDEVADEVKEIVDFLRHPERYQRLGAMVPKGVLLAGPPGTGKTLLARAVAGEANVPFFSVSASEFVEMIVGVGASRVRDLFQQAKVVAPAIIFIDELDAIGGVARRAAGPGRQRRAGADAQPDPHRDGRLHRLRAGRGHRGDQPDGGARLGVAAAGAFRPPGRRQPARSDGPPADPGRAHSRGAAGVRRRSQRHRGGHPGHGGCRLAQPHQRGGAAGCPPRPRTASSGWTSPTRWRRSCWAPPARS